MRARTIAHLLDNVRSDLARSEGTVVSCQAAGEGTFLVICKLCFCLNTYRPWKVVIYWFQMRCIVKVT